MQYDIHHTNEKIQVFLTDLRFSETIIHIKGSLLLKEDKWKGVLAGLANVTSPLET